jgi:hypothetical protein
MTFTNTRVATRQSTSTLFYNDFSSATLNYIQTAYVDTGKRLSFTQSFDPTKLIQTTVTVWAQESDLLDYRNDPNVENTQYNDYNNANNITVTHTGTST